MTELFEEYMLRGTIFAQQTRWSVKFRDEYSDCVSGTVRIYEACNVTVTLR